MTEKMKKLYRSHDFSGKVTTYVISTSMRAAIEQITAAGIRLEGEIEIDVSNHMEIALTLCGVAEHNVVRIPNALFTPRLWETYFRGEFFYGNDIETMNDKSAILLKAKKYDKLKGLVETALRQAEEYK